MPAPSFNPPGPSQWPSVDGKTFVLEQGQIIAKKYVLERPAGFGGMSQLWVATNKATGAEVCIKLLVPAENEQNDDEAVERFRREAHAAASLNHRAIVGVFDLLELDQTGEALRNTKPAKVGAEEIKKEKPYAYGIVMELLRGQTLGDLLMKRGKLPLEEALDLFLPIVSALAHAHRANVIHRDIKPDNIFLAADPDGLIIPKVLDFGVSKLPNEMAITIDGVVVGTPSFMSPEQAKGGRNIDARTDVFSAGILFYMMLTGTNPFDQGSFSSAVEAVLRRAVTPIEDLPPEIWAVLDRALQKDPNARWNDATEMGIALRKAAGRKTNTDSNPMILIEPISQRLAAAAVAAGAAGGGVDGPARRAGQDRGFDSEVSVPPVGEPDSLATPTGTKWLAAKRRRTLVAGIVGAAAALLLAAVLLQALSKKSDVANANASANTNTNATATTTYTAPSSEAIASPSASPSAPASAPAPIELDPTEKGGATTGPAATPTTTTAAGGTHGGPQPSTRGTRSPSTPTATTATTTPTNGKRIPTTPTGSIRESNIARDPGF